MRNYAKILLITLAIQLSGFVVKLLLFKLLGDADAVDMIGNIIVVISIIASVIVDFILAFRFGTSIKKKLIYIFLMPTNYLWMLYVVWTFWYIDEWIHMLTGIYK